MMVNVLVTGGYGFLGRASANKFKSQGCRVIGIGTGRWDKNESQQHGYDEWLDASVSLSSLLSLNGQFNVIAHCAGNGSVGYSLDNPLQDFKKTVETTVEVLEYMRLRNSSALLIYPSSAGVYGAKEDAPIKETDPLNPISPYGYHKRIVEELCESYSRNYHLKIVLIRFFSIYGNGLTKQLLWDASSNLLNSKGEAVFWGTGRETRDWVNVQDATELIFKASSSNNLFTVLNGANGVRLTVKEVLEILREELGISVNIKFNNNTRNGDPLFYHADISKAKSLGWLPKIPLREGIRQYVNWFKEFNKKGNG